MTSGWRNPKELMRVMLAQTHNRLRNSGSPPNSKTVLRKSQLTGSMHQPEKRGEHNRKTIQASAARLQNMLQL